MTKRQKRQKRRERRKARAHKEGPITASIAAIVTPPSATPVATAIMVKPDSIPLAPTMRQRPVTYRQNEWLLIVAHLNAQLWA